MIFFVVIFNLSIALINLYLALKIWKLRQTLSKFTQTLSKCERTFHCLLCPTPEILFQGKHNIHNLKQDYQRLELQIQQLRQMFSLVSLGYKVWQRLSIGNKLYLATKIK